MPTRSSQATWTGSIGDGKGRMRLGGGAWEGSFDVPSRFEDGEGSNPEELLAAAHAGCFSMQLSGFLTKAGYEVEEIDTEAHVTVRPDGEGGFHIPTIKLVTTGRVSGIEDDEFQTIATRAKENCPVSKALAGPEITLEATLAS